MFYSSILTFSCLLTIGCYSLTFSNFDKGTICDVSERLERGCSKETTGVRSLLQCLSRCGRDVSCIGASFDEEGKCFLHESCHEVGDCTSPDTNHNYMAKRCVYGIWDVTSRSCKCVDGRHGDRCEKYPKNCSGAETAGYAAGSTHAIHIDPEQDGHHPILVFCHLYSTGSGYKTLLMRSQGRMNFNRSWEEYKNGFYSDEFNFWAGLDSLHHLTNANYNTFMLIMRLQPLSSIYRLYRDFVVSSETLNYKFTFSSVSSPLDWSDPPAGFSFGDCLTPIKGTSFSTWDKDNDGDGHLNCASRAGSGWWYSDCDNPCNALGYGFEYWNDKPSYQLFSVRGVDMIQLQSYFDYFEMYFSE